MRGLRWLAIGLAIVPVAGLGLTASPAHASAYGDVVYGTAWNADGLANLELGKYPGRTVSVRYRAEHDGPLADARFYFKFATGKNGYSSGTGGKILIQVQSDDGSDAHLPSGTTLASVLVTNPLADAFPRVSFAPAVALTAGQLYHFVFSNVDAHPDINWVSLDDLYNAANAPGMQPAVSDTDLAVLFTESGIPWHVDDAHTPIVDIYYADGFAQGQGYIDARLSLTRAIGGSRKVRERFTVTSGDRIVTSVSVRVARTRNPKPMTVRLETGAGALIDEGTIAATSVATSPTWVQFSFAAAHILSAGQMYDVVLSAPSGKGTYAAYPLQDGTNYGFSTPTMFGDGSAQYASGTKWLDFQKNRTDFDLQLYFSRAG